MNVNTFLARQRAESNHFQLKGLYSTRKWRKRAPKDETSWKLRGAATPKALAVHRAKIEHDCFKSQAHRELIREAAKEYDAAMQREKASKKGGRPKKLKPLVARRAA